MQPVNNKRFSRRRLISLIVIVVLIIGGSVAFFLSAQRNQRESHAAGFNAFEAEDSVQSAPAVTGADASASAGQYVQFAITPQPTPTSTITPTPNPSVTPSSTPTPTPTLDPSVTPIAGTSQCTTNPNICPVNSSCRCKSILCPTPGGFPGRPCDIVLVSCGCYPN